MKEEFREVRKRVCVQHILSPFNKARKTVMYSDASCLNRLGFLLIKEDSEGNKYLISCGSLRLTKAQSGYSTT